MDVMRAFISGHLDLTPAEFAEHYQPQIDAALARGDTFIVGDARGADTMSQAYLASRYDVTVYHMMARPRNNVGMFQTMGGFKTDSERDKWMTLNSDYDIAWVRHGRKSSGTQRNLDRRKATLRI